MWATVPHLLNIYCSIRIVGLLRQYQNGAPSGLRDQNDESRGGG